LASHSFAEREQVFVGGVDHVDLLEQCAKRVSRIDAVACVERPHPYCIVFIGLNGLSCKIGAPAICEDSCKMQTAPAAQCEALRLQMLPTRGHRTVFIVFLVEQSTRNASCDLGL